MLLLPISLLLLLLLLSPHAFLLNPPTLLFEQFDWKTTNDKTTAVPTIIIEFNPTSIRNNNHNDLQLCTYMTRVDPANDEANDSLAACILLPSPSSSPTLLSYGFSPQWQEGYDSSSLFNELLTYKVRACVSEQFKTKEVQEQEKEQEQEQEQQQEQQQEPAQKSCEHARAVDEFQVKVQTSCCVQRVRAMKLDSMDGGDSGLQWSWDITESWHHSPMCSLCKSPPSPDLPLRQSVILPQLMTKKEEDVSIAVSQVQFEERSSSNLGVAARDRLALGSAGRTLFGMNFGLIGLGHGDRILLDAAMGTARFHYPKRGRNIVEFGTFRGVTSLYLGMTARLWNGRFDTFDIEDMRTENVVRAWLPETMHAHLVNVETLPPSDVAVDVVQSADFLFIDGGHKDLEAWIYNNFARVGTVMYIHDMDYTRYGGRSASNGGGGAAAVDDMVVAFLLEFGWRPILTETAIDVVSCGRVWIREIIKVPKIGSVWTNVNNHRTPNTIHFEWTAEGSSYHLSQT